MKCQVPIRRCCITNPCLSFSRLGSSVKKSKLHQIFAPRKSFGAPWGRHRSANFSRKISMDGCFYRGTSDSSDPLAKQIHVVPFQNNYNMYLVSRSEATLQKLWPIWRTSAEKWEVLSSPRATPPGKTVGSSSKIWAAKLRPTCSATCTSGRPNS